MRLVSLDVNLVYNFYLVITTKRRDCNIDAHSKLAKLIVPTLVR